MPADAHAGGALARRGHFDVDDAGALDEATLVTREACDTVASGGRSRESFIEVAAGVVLLSIVTAIAR